MRREDGDIILNFWGAPPEQLRDYAGAFHRAGRKLVESFKFRKVSEHVMACPIVYSYRHALELYLKTFVVGARQLLATRAMDAMPVGRASVSHRLVDFLPIIELINRSVGWSWDLRVQGLRTYQDFEQLVRDLDRVDQQSYSFRYPTDKKGTAALPKNFIFNIKHFCSRMDVLLTALDEAVLGLDGMADDTLKQLGNYAEAERSQEEA
ncbi:MAG TPA: hypothetical protein VEW47_16040 [Candidatus Dormibacteraeota bacterium]|nr:hypothetical protein [Candidatus Dormibacteraeota bacterium]